MARTKRTIFGPRIHRGGADEILPETELQSDGGFLRARAAPVENQAEKN